MPASLHPTPFHEAAALFRAGGLSPRAYLERCIERIEQAEPVVQAFAHLDLASARAQADAAGERYRQGRPLSPIDGMPIGVKDIIQTADMPTGMGSAIYEGGRFAADAAAVQAVRAGGGVILGKTRTTEFAIGRATLTTNPFDPSRTPGGSSSGTAAGVASGMFCAGLGTQTQGSIVRPASYCGVVGYKPTWGVLPLHGVHPVSTSHDHLGVIAATLDDAWALARWIEQHAPAASGLPALSGPEGPLPAVPATRLAVLRTQGYAELYPDALQAFEEQLEAWRGSGVVVVEPEDDAELATFCRACDDVPEWSRDMVAHEMQWPYRSYAQRHSAVLSERIHTLLEHGARLGRERYLEHEAQRQALKEQASRLRKRYDALALPAASGVAPQGLENTGSRTLLVYSSFLGLPACSLPLRRIGQLPFGTQLIGFHHADYRLLCHARWLTDVAASPAA